MTPAVSAVIHHLEAALTILQELQKAAPSDASATAAVVQALRSWRMPGLGSLGTAAEALRVQSLGLGERGEQLEAEALAQVARMIDAIAHWCEEQAIGTEAPERAETVPPAAPLPPPLPVAAPLRGLDVGALRERLAGIDDLAAPVLYEDASGTLPILAAELLPGAALGRPEPAVCVLHAAAPLRLDPVARDEALTQIALEAFGHQTIASNDRFEATVRQALERAYLAGMRAAVTL